jgi:hypothetical protein
MKLIAGRARCRLSSSAALVDELQQFGGAGRTGEGLDFIALANRSIDRPRNYQPISALWGAWTRRLLGQARRCPSRLGPRENHEWRWRESNPLNRPYSRGSVATAQHFRATRARAGPP